MYELFLFFRLLVEPAAVSPGQRVDIFVIVVIIMTATAMKNKDRKPSVTCSWKQNCRMLTLS